MARIDRQELRRQIQELQIDNELKSQLLYLVAEQKRYGLVWENSTEKVEESLRGNVPVLTEVKSRAIINDNETQKNPNHILIEGDNLEAITALTYTHEGKIDVIYIDPPYNTGKKDFIYNDRFIDQDEPYKHSIWLSFINKRLKIAKRLLSNKGVIFLSIDDHEQSQLKLLCDEIFGDCNFLGQLILKTATDNNPSQINTEHEYMLCYVKDKQEQQNWERTSAGALKILHKYFELKGLGLSIEVIQKELRQWIKQNKKTLPQVAHYNNVDEKGVYSNSSNSSNPHPGGYMYDILHPVTQKPCPKPQNGWRWPYTTFQQYDSLGEIDWGKDETTQPHVKKRIETSTEYLRTLIYEDNRGTTKALADMFDGKKVFDNPKPVNILSRIIDFSSSKASIILDFFAGSGTTLHATMKLNDEDGGQRQCILVTNNENNICEDVTYERNKRVINGYTTPKGMVVDGLTNNNLRYFKCERKSRDLSHQSKKQLVLAMTDLLRIKEDIYSEHEFFGALPLKGKSSLLRFFKDGDKQMLIIYDTRVLPFIIKEIEKMDGFIKVYIFSDGAYPYTEDFRDVAEKVELIPLPHAFNSALKHVLPNAIEETIPDVDLTQEEQDEMMAEAIVAENNE